MYSASKMTNRLPNSACGVLLVKFCVIATSGAALSTVYVSENNRTNIAHTDKRVM